MPQSMEILNVRKYGSTKAASKVKSVIGDLVELAQDQQLYFVNVVFSRPNEGFIMTRDGKVLTKTTDCPLINEQMLEIAPKAVKNLDEGKEDDLNLKFTL